jgi:hypothetical protein
MAGRLSWSRECPGGQAVWRPAPPASPRPGSRVLTALSQHKAATLLGVTRLVRHVDTKNVVSHEGEHIHVTCVPGVGGVVAGPVEAAGDDLVLQFFMLVLPSRTEWPVTDGGQGARTGAQSTGWSLRWDWGSPGPSSPFPG